MDDLRWLVGSASNSGEGRSLGSMLERGLVYGLIFGVLAFACSLTLIGFLALAVYFAALPAYGEVEAACLTAVAAAVVMAVLVFGLRRVLQPAAPLPERTPASSLAAAAQAPPPKTIWDLVTLVAAGVLAGMAQQKR